MLHDLLVKAILDAKENIGVHHECSPSQLKRLDLCPASRYMMRELNACKADIVKTIDQRVVDGVPDEEVFNGLPINLLYINMTDEFAEEGTLLHHVTELKEYVHFYDYLLEPPTCEELTNMQKELGDIVPDLEREQRTAVDECLDYVERVIMRLELEDGEVKMVIEGETDMSLWYNEHANGYVDVTLLTPRRLVVIDWKFGQGVPVTVESNPQLLSYSAGQVKRWREWAGDSTDHKLDAIEIHVGQPRLDYWGSETYKYRELTNWIKYTLTPILLATENEDAPFHPGEIQCRWCVGPICAARSDYVNEGVKEIEELMTVRDNKKISEIVAIEDVVHMIAKAKVVDRYLKDLGAFALKSAISGTAVPGKKVVEGRSSRNWLDEADALEWLENYAEETGEFDFEDLYDSKFVSVAKAEGLSKAIKKDKEFKTLWKKYPGKPTLVDEDDPREAVTIDATSVFKDYKKEE